MTFSRARRSLVTALLALAACTPASEPETTEADAQVLRGMVDQWLDAFNAGDAARLSSLYMDDAGDPTLYGCPFEMCLAIFH